MAKRILQITGAEPGWRAVYGEGEEATLGRVVAWALVEDEDAEQEIVGLVADPSDPSKILPAPDTETIELVPFTRYGFREAPSG